MHPDLVALDLVNINVARKDLWRVIGHEDDELEIVFTKTVTRSENRFRIDLQKTRKDWNSVHF
jgi:hypothetical protein